MNRCALLWLISALALSLTRAEAGILAFFESKLGRMEVELFDSEKPETVKNFVRYVESGAYTNMFAHRWVPGFVIQGGGYKTSNRFGSEPLLDLVNRFGTITNEYSVGARYSNVYGTIAMARVGGQTNSASSEWFFNLKDNSFLDTVDGGFTVFGQVLSGTNVLNRFNATSVENGIYRVNLGSPLDELPVLSADPTFEDLIYTDIRLLKVAIKGTAAGVEIEWESAADREHFVQSAPSPEGPWTDLQTVTGTGERMTIEDAYSVRGRRFYRVRVEY